MSTLNDEDAADPSVHEPRVTGAPDAIWLVYGELEHDDTHANCCAEGEVTWCESAQFPGDVRYLRADTLRARLEVAQRMYEALKVARGAQLAITPTRGNRAIHLRAELEATDAALAEWEKQQ